MALPGAAQPEPGKESHAKQEGPSSVLVCRAGVTRHVLTGPSATVSAAESIVEGGANCQTRDADQGAA
ncbi:hypothetical protein ON010_g3867 [Phytophthora cinnamomi]|nr:hypothetical protein ON010_g3867 [Phytophthora cinnamomi]